MPFALGATVTPRRDLVAAFRRHLVASGPLGSLALWSSTPSGTTSKGSPSTWRLYSCS
jgi:hypothetical protein